jgi:hypothetical protein
MRLVRKAEKRERKKCFPRDEDAKAKTQEKYDDMAPSYWLLQS